MSPVRSKISARWGVGPGSGAQNRPIIGNKCRRARRGGALRGRVQPLVDSFPGHAYTTRVCPGSVSRPYQGRGVRVSGERTKPEGHARVSARERPRFAPAPPAEPGETLPPVRERREAIRYQRCCPALAASGWPTHTA